MKTVIQWELTDTFGGEANYSWVRRGVAPSKEGENFSDSAAVRRVKKELGWQGIRCQVDNYGDEIVLRPAGMCQVCFITFHTVGNASAGRRQGMRTETTTRTLYKFHELSETAQQHALEKQAQYEAEYFDLEFVYYDAATIADLFGLDIRQTRRIRKDGSHFYDPTIYYRGFWSQGDGACFEGRYEYKRGALKAVKDYAGRDKELHRIVKALQDIQRKNFYQLTARCKHSGHYYHSGCMSVDVERSDGKEMTDDAEETVEECLRDFADWIYKQLENEYDYRTGEEACREAIEANEYEFDEKGELA